MNLEFNVLKVVTMESAVFWDVVPCSLLYVYRRFKRITCFCLKCHRVNHTGRQSVRSKSKKSSTAWQQLEYMVAHLRRLYSFEESCSVNKILLSALIQTEAVYWLTLDSFITISYIFVFLNNNNNNLTYSFKSVQVVWKYEHEGVCVCVIIIQHKWLWPII